MSFREEYICFIPDCKNNSIQNPEKRFIRVPVLPKTRELWIKAGLRLRSKKPIIDNSPLFCCENHFDLKKDTSNKWKEESGGTGIKLKRGVLPHIFPKKPPPPPTPLPLPSTVVQPPKNVEAAENEKTEDSKILQEALLKYEEKKKRKEVEKIEAQSNKKRKVIKDILAWIPMDPTSSGVNNQPNPNSILLVQPPIGPFSTSSNSPSMVNPASGQHPSLILLNQNSLITSPVVVQNGQNHLLLAPPVPKQQRLILPAESTNRPNGSVEVGNTTIQNQEMKPTPVKKGSPSSPPPSTMTIPILKNESDDVTSPGMLLIQSEYKNMRKTIATLNSEVARMKKQIDELKNKKPVTITESNKAIKNSEAQFEEKVIEAMTGVLSPAQVRMVLYSKKNGPKFKGKKKIVWSKDDIIRAINLRNNISPRGYRFLRTVLNYPVPAPTSIKRYIMLERKQLEAEQKSNEVREIKIKNSEIDGVSQEKKVVLHPVEKVKEEKCETVNGNFVPSEYLEIKIVDNQMEVNSDDIIINGDPMDSEEKYIIEGSINSGDKFIIEGSITSEGVVIEDFVEKENCQQT